MTETPSTQPETGILIEFRPASPVPDAQPMFDREGFRAKKCDHRDATFLVDASMNRVSCKKCGDAVEAIEVVKQLSNREYWRARHDNAVAYHREYAEQQAEKQATKTRKAAYATLWRFGVTPEAYAEEYRRMSLLNDLQQKQEGQETIPFSEAVRHLGT